MEAGWALWTLSALTAIFILAAVILAAAKGNRYIGGKSMAIATHVGGAYLLLRQSASWILRGGWEIKNLMAQITEIGVRSLPVTALTSVFTGMVLALQTAYSTRNIFSEPFYIGSVVGFSMVKELGPVLTALVVSGRVGAAIAAELGTMKVTEQLDALYTLGTNPVRYLAAPRFAACMLALPILTILSDIVGITGGFFVSVYKLGVPPDTFKNDILSFMRVGDLFHGVIKSIFFALIIVTVAVYQGFTCKGGAEGVGHASTQTVVISMVMILVSDYFLTALLVSFGIG